MNALLCLMVLTIPQMESRDTRVSELPGCGVCSAFAFLRCSGHPTTLEETITAFRCNFPDADLGVVSIRHVVDSLGLPGIPTRAVQVPSKQVQRLSTPCILYFRDGRWGRRPGAPGHFVALVEADEDTATILDWSGFAPVPVVRVPIDQLNQRWDGDAIVTVRHRTPLWIAAAGISAVLIAGFPRLWRRRVSSISNPGATVVLIMAGLCAGCSKKASPEGVSELPLLRFEQPAVNLGNVSAKSLQTVRFPFSVVGPESVAILRIDASCGCTTVDRSMLGRPFAPGTRHELRMNLRPDGDAGTFTKVATVVTDPPSPVPIVLAMSYEQFEPPRPSVSEVRVEGKRDAGVQATVRYVYRRKSSDPPVFALRDQIKGRYFFVRNVRTQSSRLRSAGSRRDLDLTEDVSEITLETLPMKDFAEHRGVLQVGFSDGHSDSLPTIVSVPHPFGLGASKLFLGLIKPEQTLTRRLPITGPESIGNAAVVDSEGIVSSSVVQNGVLIIEVRPGNVRGYVKGSVKVQFPGKDLPELVFPVTAMVKD